MLSGHRALVTLGATVILALSGCSADVDDRPDCTEIGAQHGISVTVAPDIAPVNKLILQVCVDGQCSHQRVTLTRDPATGTQVGFVDALLPEGPVRVGGRYVVDGRAVELGDSTIEVTPMHPNGPDCGTDGTQAVVILDHTGLH